MRLLLGTFWFTIVTWDCLLKVQGVDISKLALHFTLEIEDIPTTLVSTASIQNLQKNIDAVGQKLTDAESNCLQYIIDK